MDERPGLEARRRGTVEPRTEAGRAFLDEWFGYIDTFPDAAIDRDDATTGILAIEAEALAAYKAELREKVEGLPSDFAPMDWCGKARCGRPEAAHPRGRGARRHEFMVTSRWTTWSEVRPAVLTLLDSTDQETESRGTEHTAAIEGKAP